MVIAITIWKPTTHPLQEAIQRNLSPGLAVVMVLAGVVLLRTFLGLSAKWEGSLTVKAPEEAPVSERLSLPSNLSPFSQPAAEQARLVDAPGGR